MQCMPAASWLGTHGLSVQEIHLLSASVGFPDPAASIGRYSPDFPILRIFCNHGVLHQIVHVVIYAGADQAGAKPADVDDIALLSAQPTVAVPCLRPRSPEHQRV